MPISHKYKLIFIHIPKCAGISIWRALDLPETPDSLITFEQPILQHLPPKQLKGKYINNKIWASYKKFTVIRNPYERVMSDYFWMKNDLHASRLITGNFDDFLTLREDVVHNKKYDEDIYFDHFHPMYVYFEGIKYNHVLRFENINKEFEKLRRLYHITNNLPKVNRSEKNGFVLNQEQKDRIYNLYKKDFIRFKYKKYYENITTEKEIGQNSVILNNEELINSLQLKILALQSEKVQIEDEKNKFITALQNEKAQSISALQNEKTQIENEKNQFISAQYIEKTEIENQRNNVVNERNNLLKELSSLNEVLTHLRNENNALLNNLETKDQLIQELIDNKVFSENELRLKNESINKVSLENEKLENLVCNASAEIRAFEKNVADKEKEIIKREASILQLESKIQYSDSLLNNEKANHSIDVAKLESQINQLIQDRSDWIEELSYSKNILKNINSQKDTLEQRLLTVIAETRVLEKTISDNERSIKENELHIQRLTSQNQHLESMLNAEKQSHSKSASISNTLNNQLFKAKELLLSEMALKNEIISKISNEYHATENELIKNKTDFELTINNLTEGLKEKEEIISKIEKINVEFENSLNWYKNTYENRSVLGIIKDKVLKTVNTNKI
jgi:hypothetical protein